NMDRARKIEESQKILKIHFKDPSLLEQALSHASSCEKCNSNERLEFLGDSVVGLVVTEYLYHRFPHFQEGKLTKIKSALVSRKTMANVTRELGLHEYCIFGNSMSQKSQIPQSVLANVFEALIGAIYLDQGYEAAKEFILAHFTQKVEIFQDQKNIEDFKSLLQDYCQKHLGCTPRYKVLAAEGPEHEKTFTVAVILGDKQFETGQGRSKKKAEQSAAKATYYLIQQSPLDKEHFVQSLTEKKLPENEREEKQEKVKEKKRNGLFYTFFKSLFKK
ncbi:MAG: ribonuclease III, partial [Planctomycetota bacterium]